MCGIAGLYNFNDLISSREGAEALVGRMMVTMAHRGPDASGTWFDPSGRCVLGHRRLSIIDTSDAGRQPMSSSDGRWVITFNGEIYNFQELRAKLEAKGIYPRGRTDTEVLLLCLREWGVGILPELDGMFAFAVFDSSSGELLIARDAFGEKPLYFTELAGGAFAFSSELQALEYLPGFDAEVCPDAMAEVLMFQYIGASRSIYRHVHKLLPGHWLRLKGENSELGRFFEFRPGESVLLDADEDDLTDQLEDILLRSLRRRMITDVPLGAFLSGGVDSSVVCALIRRRLDMPLRTFSIGFQDSHESEHDIARRFADHLGTEHHEQILVPSASEFLASIGDVLDEPNADSSCLPTYLLSKFARERVTVAVSGDGGDELFLGYGRYFATLAEHSSRHENPSWSAGSAYYSDKILVSTVEDIRALFGEVPRGLAEHLNALRSEIDTSSLPLHAILRKSDLENYLPGAVIPKVDRMSMQHSLEVRTPFLNIELARFAERLPQSMLIKDGVGKQLLRKLAYRYLPKELIDMPKRGFAIPGSQWAPNELHALADRVLLSDGSRLLDCFGERQLRSFLGKDGHSRPISIYRLWSIVMLESWCRSHNVQLPEIGKTPELRQAISSAASEEGGDRQLCILPLAKDLYAAILCDAEANGDVGLSKLRELSKSSIDMLCMAMLRERDDFSSSLQAEAVPAAGRVINLNIESEKQDWLKGACLMMVDKESIKKLAVREMRCLKAWGVKEILSTHPYQSDGAVLGLKISNRSAVSPFRKIVQRLFKSDKNLTDFDYIKISPDDLKKGSGAAYKYVNDNLRRAKDCNQFSEYAIYVNGEQLPPIPATDELVSGHGDGLYYVWNETCCFSVPDNVFPKSIEIFPPHASKDAYVVKEWEGIIPDNLMSTEDRKWSELSFSESWREFRGAKARGYSMLLVDAVTDDNVLNRIVFALKDIEKESSRILVLSIVPIIKYYEDKIRQEINVKDIVFHGVNSFYDTRMLPYIFGSNEIRKYIWPLWNPLGSVAAKAVAALREQGPSHVRAIGNISERLVILAGSM